jgi:hypothetical protein
MHAYYGYKARLNVVGCQGVIYVHLHTRAVVMTSVPPLLSQLPLQYVEPVSPPHRSTEAIANSHAFHPPSQATATPTLVEPEPAAHFAKMESHIHRPPLLPEWCVHKAFLGFPQLVSHINIFPGIMDGSQRPAKACMGAGAKYCLPGTRQDLLPGIENWISSTGVGASRTISLSGSFRVNWSSPLQ